MIRQQMEAETIDHPVLFLFVISWSNQL